MKHNVHKYKLTLNQICRQKVALIDMVKKDRWHLLLTSSRTWRNKKSLQGTYMPMLRFNIQQAHDIVSVDLRITTETIIIWKVT